MSTFGVTVERIAQVWTHNNADRLEMAKVASMSYQFVIAKGSFQVGDLVLYFPIDSVLPQRIIDLLGLTGKLAGSEQNRVKTVRLRGEISQGVVAEPHLLLSDWNSGANYHEGQDVTEQLAVTKYEAPPVVSQAGTLVALPPLVSVYDIEGAERFGALVDLLMDNPVLITEKLEGSHFSASIYKDREIAISQRRFRIRPIADAEHDWHKAARLSGLLEKLPALKSEVECRRGESVEVLTVRGEMIGVGIQGNYYGLRNQQVKFFELEVNGEPIGAKDFLTLMQQFDMEPVPVLAQDVTLREWLNQRNLAAASDGKSVITPELAREGIVIRPMEEMRDPEFGRVIIKQRSPQYLASSDY
ncbi:MAG: RNA ligase (ATP) [Anaerolineae bacterium]